MAGLILGVMALATPGETALSGRTVTFILYADAMDELSPEAFTVALQIEPRGVRLNEDDAGGVVTWAVERITITDVATDTVWEQRFAGLQWTTWHGDLMQLSEDEFSLLPELTGIAVPAGTEGVPLEFSVGAAPLELGDTVKFPERSMVGLDFLFRLLSDRQSLLQAESEPGEIFLGEEGA